MKIYTIRHGETNINHQNRVLGRTDEPLNYTGLKQADQAGKALKDIAFDAVYCSPMKRAMQTGEAISKNTSFPFAMKIAPALIEQNFGVFEGALRNDPEYQKEKHQYFKPFEGGESFLDVAARVYTFLDELQKQYPSKAHNVLLVTHGGICRVIENYFKGMDNEAYAGAFYQNCEVKVFDTDTLHRDSLQPLTPSSCVRDDDTHEEKR